MSIFRVGKFVVRQENQAEFKSLWQRFLMYQKENPEKFRELKSGYRLFTQTFGDMQGAYIMMVEFASLANLEKYQTRMLGEDKVTIKIVEEFMSLIEPASYSLSIWNTIE